MYLRGNKQQNHSRLLEAFSIGTLHVIAAFHGHGCNRADRLMYATQPCHAVDTPSGGPMSARKNIPCSVQLRLVVLLLENYPHIPRNLQLYTLTHPKTFKYVHPIYPPSP